MITNGKEFVLNLAFGILIIPMIFIGMWGIDKIFDAAFEKTVKKKTESENED